MTELLYGKDNSENIVRIEVINNCIYEYIQDGDNTYCNIVNNYTPSILTHNEINPNLKGDNYYNHLEYLPNYKEYNYINDRSRERYLKVHNLANHYMIETGKTLFKGMTFDEIKTIAFDIETTGLDPYRAKIINTYDLKKYIPKRINSFASYILAYFETSIQNDEYISLEELFKILEKVDDKIDIRYLIMLWRNLFISNVIQDYGDTVEMVSLASNYGYEKVIYSDNEHEIINEFVYEIYNEDPNVLLFYNGYSFDLPFLMYRALVNNIKFAIGRDYHEPDISKIQLRLDGGLNKSMMSYTVFGRNCIDLLPFVKKYDFTDRKQNNYQLKNVISTYGLERPGRIILDNEEIQEGLSSDKTSIKYKNTIEYCLDDSRDCINLHKYIAQADFYITQMLPFNYDTLCYLGNVGRINGLMLREYYRQAYSVPKWEKHLDYEQLEVGSLLKYDGNNPDLEKKEVYEVVNKFHDVFEVKNITTDKVINVKNWELNMFTLNIEGAAVQAEDTGIFNNIVDSDVGSMYPSLMIKYDIFPASDKLGVMKQSLLELRAMRFEMKKETKKHKKESKVYALAKSKDLAYKIFLNSAFGALSSNGFYFKDSNKCASVTRHGRELILSIRDYLVEKGYKVTSLDTDGVSYTNGTKPDIDKINEELSSFLPEGITIETEFFKNIIVFGKKTYCAIKENGDIKMRGSALTNIKFAPVIRRFINKMCPMLAEKKFDELKVFLKNIKSQINNNELPVEEYIQVQKISRSVAKYQSNLETKDNAKRDKVYDLAIETDKSLVLGDKVETYHSYKYVDKNLSKKEEEKKIQANLMDNMFGDEYIHPQVKVDCIKWVEDFDDDINSEYYINVLNKTAKRLLLKSYDEKKKQWSGVLSQEQFEYIAETQSIDINDYKYMDYAYIVPSIKSMSAWNRIEESKLADIIKQNVTDSYVTIQRFKTPNREDIEVSFHPLYFDIDGTKLKYAFDDAQCIYMYFKNYLKVPDECIKVWFSGSKGFHIEIDARLFGLKPMINLQLINKEIARMLVKKFRLTTIDIGSIYSKKRMWRVPFSINSKSGKRKTLIHNFEDFNSVSEIEMYVDSITESIHTHVDAYISTFNKNEYLAINPTLKKWISEYITNYETNLFKEIIKKNKILYNKLDGNIPKCIQHLIESGIKESGQRNIATVVLASFFKESGRSKEETIDILVNFTENIPKHLTSIKECAIIHNVTTVVNSVYSSENYSFQCYYIKSLLRGTGFRCNANCVLKD